MALTIGTPHPVESAGLLYVSLEPQRYHHPQREVADSCDAKHGHHELTQQVLLSDGVSERWDPLVEHEGKGQNGDGYQLPSHIETEHNSRKI